VRHYSIRTQDAYADWIKRFILFHDKRHPQEMGAAEINRFLTHLAVVGKVAASTQNQAFAALLFFVSEGARSRSGTHRRCDSRQAA
jgi:hypothetical protein